MAPRYDSVAIIGTGPSGISAVKALSDENVFSRIRVFERRDRPGGLWHYDPIPDVFPTPGVNPEIRPAIPESLPAFTDPVAEDLTARTGIHDALDSNVGSEVMEFTHTPFPLVNSAISVRQLGHANPSRPFRVVAGYLEDILRPYLDLVTFSTTIERVEKIGSKWRVTARQRGHFHRNKPAEYWWAEEFDAVIVASGHYNVPLIPEIEGLDEAFKQAPNVFEHSKSFRLANEYVDKRVVVVGGNISSADLIADLHAVVRGGLVLSQRGKNEALNNVFTLPGVEVKPTIARVESSAGGSGVNLTFSDGSTVEDVDKVIFATGYKLSYPFLVPDVVTPSNRVSGFYQHIFKIGDPSLALVGQVRGALSFRVYEYQAVAVARYFAAHNAKPLPSPKEQDDWEVERLKYKGNSAIFHEIKPDFKEYFEWLREFSGPAVRGTTAYALPVYRDNWAELGFAILQLKDKYWQEIKRAGERVVAKL
jgi:cation diffusion facilitator CzcD-associated flavoprotein CzcO